jgi:undecaprenyl-phosphate 4-deoxy-4-formamido-L-arabinose transferase
MNGQKGCLHWEGVEGIVQNMSNTSLSIVIPVYNSAAILPELIKQLHELLPAMAVNHEIILVNDGSKDESWAVICSLTAEYPELRGINMMRNYGQHNALLCGIRAARLAIIVTMDDDLQHPPAEIQKLLAKLAEGFDVVYGFPQKERHGFLRTLASQMTKIALQRSMGAETARKISAFRAFPSGLSAAFADYRSPFVSIDVLLTWGATRFTAITVRHAPRNSGASNYTFMKLLTHAFNMMTGFSVIPLQIASFMGFACALFGLFILVYVLGRYFLLGYSVPGFPFLASIIAIFSGAQLLALGIIGEYLARMHFRMMERPTYTIKTTTDQGTGNG